MSSYLLVVSDRQRADDLEGWLSSFSSSEASEVVRLEIAPDRWLTYVSRDPFSEMTGDRRAVFKGYAIDHREKSIIFGAQGLSDFLVKNGALPDSETAGEGCYLSVRWDERRVDISTDLFSLCPMLYCSGSGLVAVSDSTYILVQLRRALGLACTMDEEAAVARSWANAMAGQMLSEDGFVEEVKFAHVGVALRIELWPLVNLVVQRRTVQQDFQLGDKRYVDAVRSSAVRIASTLNSLAGIAVNSTYLALSGGMDSRVCLAAALLGGQSRESAAFNCINTNSSHARDFEVVQSLSDRFGFSLGLRDAQSWRPVKVKSAEKLGSWYLSNAGIYDFLYLSPPATTTTERMSVGGHGAELHKGNYGWRQIRTIAKAIDNKVVATAFREQCEKGISAMGVKPDDVYGSEWHYLGFRNAIHSGRFVTATMTGLRPLMTRDLVALSRSELNEWKAPKKGGQSLISDLLITLSPEMAAHPFDDPKKDMLLSDIQDRSQYLGGPLSEEELDRYTIHGSIGSVVNGSPRLFAGVLTADGRNLVLDRENLRVLVKESFAKLEGCMRDVYEASFVEANTKLDDPTLAIPQMRTSIGKFLSLGLAN